jgi:acetoin utilization deacetylase AcuC-like enzyme
LEQRFGKGTVSVIDRRATEAELCSVHDPAYIAQLFSVQDDMYLDRETFFSQASLEGIRRAGGICLELMERILAGKEDKTFALIRPPGHHAGYSYGLGYCVINNLALAVKTALQTLRRIAVIDWDVHHGNGTQELFEETDKVFFIDIHQENLFPPKSGGADERGRNVGKGFTLNLPLPPGSGRTQYFDALDAIYPALQSYRPELICVSAGFDAVSGDLEGNMELRPRDFGEMTSRICAWADIFCGGKVFMTLEGGYRVESVSESLSECIAVLRHGKPNLSE